MSRRWWRVGWRQDEFARLVLLAVGVRLLLVPLTHTWDGQTWANVFAELARSGNPLDAIHQPYETMRELSLLTAAAGRHMDFYEYWAYPPLQLYVYWPLAHLYTFLGGRLDPSFVVQPAMIAPSLSAGLLLLIHTPNIVADVAALYLMRALGVSLVNLRRYAFNPLVLLVGIWTFDAVMVAFLLLGLYWAERGRPTLSGVAIALGAATKFVPLVALPVVLLSTLDSTLPLRRRVAQCVITLLTCLGVLALVVWPVLDGVVYVVQFQLQRFGAGLSLAQTPTTLAGPNGDWRPPVDAYASAELGGLVLPLTLLAGSYLVVRWRLSVNSAFFVLVLAFLAGAKVVNEPYALSALALGTIELDRRPTSTLEAGYLLLWLAPFAYAMLNTPAWGFLLSELQWAVPTLTAGIDVWLHAYGTFRSLPEARWPYTLITVAFDVGICTAVWSVLRSASAFRTLQARG